jgi:hypothetical protein
LLPPLAAFSTGAGRLLLALLERLVTDAGGNWLCTDTDSMAIATDLTDPSTGTRQNHQPDAISLDTVDAIIERFRPLWPFASEGNILKLEGENFDPDSGSRRPLYGIAIAAKRYVLLNLDQRGSPIIRKRSEHGLGLFVSPHGPDDKQKRWIDALWQDIVDNLLDRPRAARPWHEYPVIGRVPVTTWELLESFNNYNRAHPEARVRPFNFVSAAYLKPLTRPEPIRLFAPFVSEPAKALETPWYEHNTGRRVRITTEDPMGELNHDVIPVKTYGDLAHQYAEHPEVKFADDKGERCQPMTAGALHRRHIIATRTEPYGKEGNVLRRRAEGPGIGDEAQHLYIDQSDFKRIVLPVARAMPQRELAAAIGMSPRGLRKILNGYSGGTPTSRKAIGHAAALWASVGLKRSASIDPLDVCAAWLAEAAITTARTRCA